MSPPIYTPDGTEVSEIVLPDGSTASEVIGPDGNVVFEAGPDIPDSVVSRDPDDRSFTPGRKFGVVFETTVDWPEIGAKLSGNHSGGTRAYLYLEDSGDLVEDVDISGITAGDTFTFSNVGLTGGNSYRIVVDAEGQTYTSGIDDNPNFPYSSSDGNLTITGGAADETNTSSAPHNIIELGNVGF